MQREDEGNCINMNQKGDSFSFINLSCGAFFMDIMYMFHFLLLLLLSCSLPYAYDLRVGGFSHYNIYTHKKNKKRSDAAASW